MGVWRQGGGGAAPGHGTRTQARATAKQVVHAEAGRARLEHVADPLPPTNR